jgi:hypothetical protein
MDAYTKITIHKYNFRLYYMYVVYQQNRIPYKRRYKIEFTKILKEISRVLMKDGILLCRVNSINDRNYGAGQGIEIEESEINRYNNRKIAWEISIKKI